MWSNWAGDQRCEPAVVERPTAVGEVVGAVERAVAAGRCVRVAGSGHSFTSAVLTDGALFSLDRMGALLEADRATGAVRVEAGITLHALSDALAEHGLAMPNLGDIDEQSIAGAISTATHGTGITLANLSAQVRALRLVTAAGEIRELDGGDDLLAARVAIGALGIVTEVTLQTVPAFTLRGVDAPVPLAEILDGLEARVSGHRHFEFFVFPHADSALTRTNVAVDEPAQPRPKLRAYVDDVLLANRAFQLACVIGRAFPAAIPSLNRLVTRLAGISTRTDRSDRIFATPRLVRFTEMEYALPRPVAADAVRAIKATAERHAINFPIEVRFVAPDDALLSPAHERETAYIAVHAFKGMDWEPYFRAVEAIADEHGGRPHWGKRHFQTAATLAPRYPGWERFAAVRTRMDPDGVFSNVYTDRVLGPAAV
ncbi:MAG: D-arabinono-1,4-lactone oxidase [Solirubrobacteraceae bacterium]